LEFWILDTEAFEKCSVLIKSKEDKNFNRRNTLSILRINPLKYGGGLKFESDPRGMGYAFHGACAGIGQKGAFCKGLEI
jgi:hypothetical protein